MTDAQVKALANKLRNAVMSAPPDIDAAEAMVPLLTAALDARKREVWDAVQHEGAMMMRDLEDNRNFQQRDGIRQLLKRLNWCRRQGVSK